MKIKNLAIILALCLLTLTAFAACTGGSETETSPESQTESESVKDTDPETSSETQPTESNADSTPETAPSLSDSGSENLTHPETDEPTETPVVTESETDAPTDAPIVTESETDAPTETPVVTESEPENVTTPIDTDTPTATESATETVLEPETETEPIVSIEFNGSSANISDKTGVSVSGKIYTITAAGIYRITGTMNDGQIRVNVAKTEKVTLLLDNFTGSCSDSAVIYVMSADEVYIDLEKHSVNTLTDAQIYVFENPLDDKPNACIYSSDDLTIKGGGTLYVNARYNNGIGCKNDLDIKNGVVHVSAVKNALKGNDSVTVRGDAKVYVSNAKDALKSDTLESEKPGKGFVLITEEAYVSVSCSDEAVQATQNITITTGATLEVVSAKNPYKCDGTVSIDEGCLI